MSHVRDDRTFLRRALAFTALVALGLAALVAVPGVRAARRPPASPAPAAPALPEMPGIRETPVNLQEAFTNEMNASKRYAAFAERAEADSQPGIARLFRACALAESVHARRFTQAIAYNRQPARALLERLAVGTTAENLQAALGLERREIESWYPALLERARVDRQTMAMRAITLALGAERTHVVLLEGAQAGLPGRPAFAALHVCPFCGRVTAEPGQAKCPACFTDTSRFLRPA